MPGRVVELSRLIWGRLVDKSRFSCACLAANVEDRARHARKVAKRNCADQGVLRGDAAMGAPDKGRERAAKSVGHLLSRTDLRPSVGQ